MLCRSPLGLRGLKYRGWSAIRNSLCQSQPSWAAWIEMAMVFVGALAAMSQPSWAAWIEIIIVVIIVTHWKVAALLGCVD